MEFDVIELSEQELASLTTVQMQLLRTAQKNKNELYRKMQQDIALFKKVVYTDGMKDSSLLEQKQAELEEEYNYKISVIVEQLLYSFALSEPYPDRGDNDDSVGYIVDYSLSHTDRYIIVRDYYLAIADPAERMSLYQNDQTAKQYLGGYYATLYNVLYTYSQ